MREGVLATSTTVFQQKTVSAQEILRALEDFEAQYADTNDYDSWLDKRIYKYAVQYADRLYPCKYILSQATGIHTSEFGGGEQTNRVFRDLGFNVINKP